MSSTVTPVMGNIQILIRWHVQITELDDWKWDFESFISNYDHLNSPRSLTQKQCISLHVPNLKLTLGEFKRSLHSFRLGAQGEIHCSWASFNLDDIFWGQWVF